MFHESLLESKTGRPARNLVAGTGFTRSTDGSAAYPSCRRRHCQLQGARKSHLTRAAGPESVQNCSLGTGGAARYPNSAGESVYIRTAFCREGILCSNSFWPPTWRSFEEHLSI